MNYLAHFYLAGENPDLLTGNFIADAVKGNKYLDYPEGIQRGILMHRAIDHFTDTHEITSRSKARLHAEFHHYAGVIVDVFYDHFLAASWSKYSAESLEDFSAKTYRFLLSKKETFPERAQYMLPFMVKHDWLMAYPHIEGIRRVLTGMSKRTKFISGMENAAGALQRDYAFFKSDFEKFFPEIVSFTQSFRET